MVDCFEVNNCYLCPPTFLLPMSPAGQPSGACWLRLNDYNAKAYVVVPPLRFEPQSKC